MQRNIFLLLLISFITLLCSCKVPQDIVYLQDVDSHSEWKPDVINDIRVQPGDKMSILVSSRTPELCSIFNLTAARNYVGSGSTGISSGTGNNQSSYFTVNTSGEINYPVFGKLKIAGMTRSEISEFIANKIIEGDYVRDPVVTVEFVNLGFSILGEVKNSGYKTFNKDRITILEALAMAGDLSITGRRDNILVIRTDENGISHNHRIDLRDSYRLYTSPAYYIQQNDVIYVEPNETATLNSTVNGRQSRTPSFWISLFSFGVTLAILIKGL